MAMNSSGIGSASRHMRANRRGLHTTTPTSFLKAGVARAGHGTIRVPLGALHV